MGVGCVLRALLLQFLEPIVRSLHEYFERKLERVVWMLARIWAREVERLTGKRARIYWHQDPELPLRYCIVEVDELTMEEWERLSRILHNIKHLRELRERNLVLWSDIVSRLIFMPKTLSEARST